MTPNKSQISILFCVLFLYECKSHSKFGTSSYYTNLKILSDENEFYLPLRISKEMSQTTARMECAIYCGINFECKAFNFYEKDESYVCEIVPDNLCTNRANKAFVAQVGGQIWDKLGLLDTKSCIDMLQASGQGISCQIFRPGCLGTWPNCYGCTKTCIDCNSRSLQKCVMWPDGDEQDSVPIIGQCNKQSTKLMARRVDSITGNVLQSYQMALYDMHRISRLKVYNVFQFYFDNFNGNRMAKYRNWAIDANGTLMNLIFIPPGFDPYMTERDILNLNGQALKPAPFVEVTDDREGCGSFWLLNPNNSTFCPGGKTALFGTPSPGGSTGIKCSSCDWGSPMEFGSVTLWN